MGSSLQEALEKAGLKSSEQEKERRSKPKRSGKPSKAIDKHHRQRHLCDLCKKTAPDVEFYKHKNPSLNASWLCIVCADLNSIPDDTRQTNQSDFAMRGTFRRRYGRTKVFKEAEQSE